MAVLDIPSWRLAIGVAAVALAGAIASLPDADAQAVIDNGIIKMGVNLNGDLNVIPVEGGVALRAEGDACTVDICIGLTYMPTGFDGTAPGCACEAWGLAYDGVVTGYSRDYRASPGAGLVILPFVSTASTAISTVLVGDMMVVHDYHPSAHPNLYEATVTITNIGPVPHNNVLYRRAMDWDISPPFPVQFREYVTIGGICPVPTTLVYSSDNGFASGNPLTPHFLDMGGAPRLSLGPPDCDNYFEDSGPADHGAMFEFNFGTLAPGADRIFNIYYGATANEGAALSALASVDAQIWSLGQPNSEAGYIAGTPNTFIFGFNGVYNEPPIIIDPPPPCSQRAIRVLDGDLVPLFGATPQPAGWYEATYMEGAMVRSPLTLWDVQHAPKNALGYGAWVTGNSGAPWHFLPGLPTNSPTPMAAEAANAGVANVFYWPGGQMFFRHIDNYLDNAEGLPNPTWRICPGQEPPPEPLYLPPDPAAPSCSPATQTVNIGDPATLFGSGGNGQYDWHSEGATPQRVRDSDQYDPAYSGPGTYTVTVLSGPKSAQCRVVVPPYPSPSAAFSAAMAGGGPCGPVTVTFTDASSPPPGRDITVWFWEFGDGGSSSEQNPSHDYEESGRYRVTLRVTDDRGMTGTTTSDVIIPARVCQQGVQRPEEGRRPGSSPRDGFDEDAAGASSDGDAVPDALDNCPHISNDDQADLDLDGVGDACDPDMDGDGIANTADNCLEDSNRDQSDVDMNGIGDACDEPVQSPFGQEEWLEQPIYEAARKPGRDVQVLTVEGEAASLPATARGGMVLLAGLVAVALVFAVARRKR